ncbi:helix-turn-helix domain-containing protein [Streptomyces viridochromogenes]|uniref:Putative DNA-binding protein n=1 Tax=Streptomyces viridochromogenes Tue57 TaxID=1160705 RepID=L8PFY5_STRVR|nr:helix-turn-helix transcriptional regulator [Streptomyces viridochromogenes]ELS54292.1 putative DNA-binding protein [Streptomyces viridochromogenes Tue57]
MASLNVGNLGDYLREQRRNAQLSLRQLADAAGVSNPYLSQIERGLRKPSAEVLQQVAKALRISAETLYVRAGILDAERDRDDVETRAVILADPTLNERQKQVLLQIYESFRKENGFGISPEAGAAAEAVGSAEAVSRGAGVMEPDSGSGSDRGSLQSDAHRDGAADAQDGDTAVRRSRTTRTNSTADGGRKSATRRTRTTRTTRTSDGSAADPENPTDPQQSAG